MEESVLPLNSILGTPSDTFMDLDYIDELLLEGCWLEANGSEFSQFNVSTPISPFEPSFVWPTLEPNNGESGGIPSKEQKHRSSFPENVSISPSQGPQHCRKPQSHVENISNALGPFESENNSIEGSELSRRWWIGPGASTSVMDRLIRALDYIKDLSRDKDKLIQVWVPVNRGGKCVLTTNNQLCLLDLNSPRLAHYREISMSYQFPAEEDSKEGVGLPGRVFRSKIPEWTPDVRYFTREEYPRVSHARKYEICGTLAVPVLEQGSRNCLGVIEVVLTRQNIKYHPEIESVCKALEAVDLRGSEVHSPQNVEACDLSYQAAIPEIIEVLQSACTTHGLPLAQTWVPCILQGKGGCRHSDENLENCVSTVDSACHIGDSRIQGFHEACSEYHLLKGQGIVGQAFRTNQPCFSSDVTSYSKADYPLSHHARMFGLQAAVAIRLRSTRTGSADFVLEFFLPVNCRNPEDQKKMLTSLSTIIQNVCQTLRVVTDRESQENLPEKVENPPVMRFGKEVPKADQMHFVRPYSRQANHEESVGAFSFFHDGNSREILAESSEVRSDQPDSNSREGITFSTKPSTSGDGSSLYTNKTGEKKRVKAEKTITLQVLRQHFAGSLKDAARNLGVCPTTLKRICRQHGIQRWPSRKIKKVGHSLQKIQRVIDSVQGASGVLQIESFYSNFPELASPNASRTTHFTFESADHVKPLDIHPETGVLSPPAAASVSPSSSCSQSSSSSQCCSNGTQPNSYTLSIACQEESIIKEECVDGMLKRARSDANLHLFGEGPKLFSRSQSHVSFYGNAKQEISPPAVECSHPKSQERDGPRVKVTFGEEKIRFRIQNNWGYRVLLQEISRRFGVDDASGYHLKYLDDDAEWVLLTCDADLEECIDVWRSTQSDTVKLSFLRDSQPQFGTSCGSRGSL